MSAWQKGDCQVHTGVWNHWAWRSSVEFHLFLQGPLAHTCPECPVLFKGHNNWFLRQMAGATATAQTASGLLKVNIAWNWALSISHCTKFNRQFHTLVPLLSKFFTYVLYMYIAYANPLKRFLYHQEKHCNSTGCHTFPSAQAKQYLREVKSDIICPNSHK